MKMNDLYIRDLQLEIGALYKVPSSGPTSVENAIVYVSFGKYKAKLQSKIHFAITLKTNLTRQLDEIYSAFNAWFKSIGTCSIGAHRSMNPHNQWIFQQDQWNNVLRTNSPDWGRYWVTCFDERFTWKLHWWLQFITITNCVFKMKLWKFKIGYGWL